MEAPGSQTVGAHTMLKDDRTEKLNKDMSKFVANGSEKKPSQKSREEKIKTGNVLMRRLYNNRTYF